MVLIFLLSVEIQLKIDLMHIMLKEMQFAQLLLIDQESFKLILFQNSICRNKLMKLNQQNQHHKFQQQVNFVFSENHKFIVLDLYLIWHHYQVNIIQQGLPIYFQQHYNDQRLKHESIQLYQIYFVQLNHQNLCSPYILYQQNLFNIVFIILYPFFFYVIFCQSLLIIILQLMQSQGKDQQVVVITRKSVKQCKHQGEVNIPRMIHMENFGAGYLRAFVRKFSKQSNQNKQTTSDIEKSAIIFHNWKNKTENQNVQVKLEQEIISNISANNIKVKEEDLQHARILGFQIIEQYLNAIHQKDQKKQKELQKKIQTMKRHYSNKDKLFVTEILKSFFKCYSKDFCYIAPNKSDDKLPILQPFKDNQIVGIIGDWGTGLRDAHGLMEDLVLKKGATVILHLGDVYYAGLRQQYMKVLQTLDQIRKKSNKKIRYYTIPGNHDYYTFGKQFQWFLKRANEEKYIQNASFFCLRNESNTWQFLGMDTSRASPLFTKRIDPRFKGAHLMQQQRKWHVNKIQNFKGNTILLSHHQLFQITGPVIGQKCHFGHRHSQINYRLSQQLFEYLPNISCWFWGHTHALQFYRDCSYGLPKARLLGNSAFQVNASQKPYEIKYPYPPPIQDYKKYIPLTDASGYYDHTYAILYGFDKKQEIKADYFNVSSSYQKEPIVRPGVFRSQKILMKPKYQEVIVNKPIFIKQSSGLSISCKKSFINKIVQFATQPEAFILLSKSQEPYLYHNQQITIKSYQGEFANLYISKGKHLSNDVFLEEQRKQDYSIWIIQTISIDKKLKLRYGDTFILKNKKSGKYLGRHFHKVRRFFSLVAQSTNMDNTLIEDSVGNNFICKFQIFKYYGL